MYERFTDRARKVMQIANQEARDRNHESIGTEHILLGLAKEGSGVGANVLHNLGVDLRRLRAEVEAMAPPRAASPAASRLPHKAEAKRVIEYAMEEARNLGHNYVGTEHILLGLTRQPAEVTGQILRNFGLSPDAVTRQVKQLLGHGYAETVTATEPLSRRLGRAVRNCITWLRGLFR